AMFEGGLAILAVALGWALDSPPLVTFHFNLLNLGWGLLATLPPLAMLYLCLKAPWKPIKRIIQILDETIIPFFLQSSLLELAVICLLAGVGEEMLFRGIVQDWVTNKMGGTYGIALGLIVSAVVFGLLHGITATYALLATAIGLYLGAIWLLTGNLLVPIVAHSLYDFFAMAYFIHSRKPPTENISQA
ncbi:MAG: CPBP family intramembrane glutamic endopeptidase, partial [Thermoguttaceae bacterium]